MFADGFAARLTLRPEPVARGAATGSGNRRALFEDHPIAQCSDLMALLEAVRCEDIRTTLPPGRHEA